MSIAFSCDKCGQRYQVGDEQAGREVACKNCGATLTIPAESAPLDVEPLPANPYAAPRADLRNPSDRPAGGGDGGDETVATIIPYKNASALLAYYLGLFSCIPYLGLPMAVVALVLGVKGLKAVRRDPKAHGTAHAWVGLVCGTIGLLFNLLMTIGLVVAIIGSRQMRVGRPPL